MRATALLPSMSDYRWPAGAPWLPDCNPLADVVRPLVQAWEARVFGTELDANYDVAYLVSVFLPDVSDPAFLELAARFAYVVFTLDSLLEWVATERSSTEFEAALDVFEAVSRGGEPDPIALARTPARLRRYAEPLRSVCAALQAVSPDPVHRATLRETRCTYFRDGMRNERHAKVTGRFTWADYVRFRTQTVQTLMGFDVITLLHPVTAADMRALGNLREDASLLTGIVNDITSFPRERVEASSGINLVCHTMAQGCTAAVALDACLAQANVLIDRCERHRTEIHARMPHLAALADACVKATIGECWYFHTAARYLQERSPEAFIAATAVTGAPIAAR